MEIQVLKLRETLKLLQPVVPKKAALEALKNVLLGDGKAMATDYETAVWVELPEAVEPMLMPVRLLLDFLEFAPGYLKAKVEVGKDGLTHSKMTIDIGDSSSSFVTERPDDFPTFSGKFEPQYSGSLDGEALLKSLTTVSDCAGVDVARPVLSSVCLTTGENVQAVTASGFQLAIDSVPGSLPGEKPLLIPRRAIGFLEQLWKKASEPDLSGAKSIAEIAIAKRPIRLEWDDKYLQLKFGRVTMLIQLIQGTFPNYTQLIPKDFTSTVTVYAEDLARAVNQVSIIARDASGITRLKWEGEKLTVAAKAEDVGAAQVNLKAQSTGPGFIAFNSNYLLNYLSSLQGEVTLSITSEIGPGLFSHRRSTRVIMPMFVQWVGKPKNAEPPAVPCEDEGPVGMPSEHDVFDDALDEASKESTEPEPEKPKKRRGRKAKE